MATVAAKPRSGGRGNRLMFFAALAFGLLTAALLFAYLQRQEDQQLARTEANVPVVVAKREIALGTTITAGMLTVKNVTPDTAITAAFADTGKLVGLRSRTTIPANAQIVPGMVAQAGGSDALSFVVPAGKRAVAVTLSEVIGSGGHIRPGDFVDVMVVMEVSKLTGVVPEQGKDDKRMGVVTILQNIEVLAVADEATKAAESGPATKESGKADRGAFGSGGSASRNKSVTLAVAPDQAQALFLADQEGKIRLSLRPFGERDDASVTPALRPLAGQGVKP